MNPSLQLRTAQSLVMTEQLQQSIKLLQLSALELTEFIEQELEKNPLLAVEEPSSSSPQEEEPATSQEEAGEGDAVASIDASNDDIWGGELESSQRYEENGASGGRDGDGSGTSFVSDMIEQSHAEAPSLKDHLLAQVQVDIADVTQRIIAAHLIDLLDDSGYLREDWSHLPALLGCEGEEVEAVLALLQRCDPPGVFARDLRECLALQLRDKGMLSPLMDRLLNHLDLLADSGAKKKLARLCHISEEELAELLAVLRRLDPRPGSNFACEQAQTLIPDVIVRKLGKDGWRVEANADVLPKLLVNRQYYNDLSSRAREREDKKFLNEHLANANWLVKALDQRAQTLLKVASAIVLQQEMFLEHGIRYLRPMTLRQIAEAVEVHESTVSRVTSSKYMATPRGVFPMKYFFSSSLSDAGGGEGTSSRAVMHMIREMIDAEGAEILSDDAIAERLGEKGIDVARRTVVKYRKLMNIPSSVERRREKRGN